ncbi:MAG: DUF7619 domain-containing protein [Chitinophagales bacterium]
MFSTHTHKKTVKILFLFFSILFISNSSLKAQCTGVLVNDSLALVAFYAATNGDSWQNNEGWLSAPVSEWHGVTLTSNGCSIKIINLAYEQLEGFLPDLNLPNLEELTLFNNKLSGEIPNFSNLPSLKRLYLGNITVSSWANEFAGNIPDFSNLPNLEELHLGQNRLSGEIPDFSNLENLKKMELGNSANFQFNAFEMESNDLVGEIPDFSNLPNLVNLSLSGNRLTGSIPDFSNLPKLQSLNLGENQLTGNIPDFSNLDSLYYLQLVENQLTGSIPDFSNLPNLEDLSLANNQLNGMMPNFSNLTLLKYARLNNNNLSGNIPNFSNLLSLESLNLEENQLTGIIPNLDNTTNLMNLLLGKNNLSGIIPNFSSLSNLGYFSCEENQLTGAIPNFSNNPVLCCLILSSNNLFGEIPDFNLPELTNLYLYENQLTGAIPNFANLPNLVNLFLHDNQLSSTIPNFDNLPSLLNLYLQHNELVGFIPDFNNLASLGTLYIHGNEFIGEVPNFNLPNLEHLKICPNNLTGSLPLLNNCPEIVLETIDFSCIETAQTTGFIYADTNGNCTKEEEEPTIPNAIIATMDSTAYAFSDENGFYNLKTDTGTHTFYTVIPNYLWQNTCPDYPNTYTIDIENTTDSLSGYDFGFQSLIACPLMLVEVSTPLLRRCFTNTYTVHYCNTGTVAAENASIKLVLDEAIIPLSSSLPYASNIENELIFDIGTVGIGQCGSFSLTDSLRCDAVLGSTACIEAYALPNDLCFATNTLWDGSDLEINAYCFGNEVLFQIINRGDDMEQESEYRMYEDDIMSIGSPFQLVAGDTLEISRSTTGQTFRLTAYQTPNHPSSIFVTEVLELCGANTENASLGFVNTQSNLDYTQFYDIECQEIIGSYDPNDKNVTPKGVGDEHRITDNQELEYKIRFQNVGSDTAFRVMIIDTIDTNFLDINSLKLGVSSHDYTAEIKDGKVLIFTFENIFLVHSEVNEPASHGFVMFKISQKIGNQKDDLIQNEASIYFDYNQPVITNKAFNTIGLPDSTTSIPIVSQIKGDIPASIYYENGYLHIQLSLAAKNLAYSFTLFDILGKQIAHEKQLFIPNHEMSVGDLRQGVYVFEIATNDGKKVGGKFIVP